MLHIPGGTKAARGGGKLYILPTSTSHLPIDVHAGTSYLVMLGKISEQELYYQARSHIDVHSAGSSNQVLLPSIQILVFVLWIEWGRGVPLRPGFLHGRGVSRRSKWGRKLGQVRCPGTKHPMSGTNQNRYAEKPDSLVRETG